MNSNKEFWEKRFNDEGKVWGELPSKSAYQALELFRKAGIRVFSSDRSYFPYCDDEEIEVMLIRSQEMARYVQDGLFDAGITGQDWILETNAKVKQICELIYAKSGFKPVRWVLAVPESSKIRSVKDLQGKTIATELVNYVKRYMAKRQVKAKVEYSWGATEAKAGILVDAIVELTETGRSLKANQLRIVEEILSSTTRFIANREAWRDSWKRQKMENIAILLKGALAAEGMVGLKMNLKEKDLSEIMEILPSLKRPTVSPLTLPGWIALEVVVEEDIVQTGATYSLPNRHLREFSLEKPSKEDKGFNYRGRKPRDD